ncbi:hypothetical protein AB0H36_36685 [Kribbella sp. NPDC050820]|uniref:hypothetical protein n=1 Tax=Kribbella sp. NPDC050820 TaxID=3155408 RepID=UPI0034098EFB
MPWPRTPSWFLAIRDDRETRYEVLQSARDAVAGGNEAELEAELDRSLFGALAQAGTPPEGLLQQAERGLASAERTGRVALRIAAMNQLAWASSAQGDFQRSLQVAEAIVALVDGAPEAESSRPRAMDQLGGALVMLGRIPEGQKARREACALSAPGTRLHAIRLVMLAEALLADDDLGASHVSELTTIVAEAREIVTRIGDELGTAHVDNTEAQLLILIGDRDGGDTLLQRAAEVLTRRPDASGAAANAIGRARLNVARGRPAEARRILETAIADDPAVGHAVQEIQHQQRLLGCG